MGEAENTVMQSIGGSALLTGASVSISPQGNGTFTLSVSAQHPLVFVPTEWKTKTAVSLNSKLDLTDVDPQPIDEFFGIK